MDAIQTNLRTIQHKIREYEQRYHRAPGSVILLAASKKQSIEKMKSAIAAGQYIFGENYLQEALTKMAALDNYPLEWHFIGPIQRNKTRKIAENFHWVHSVSSQLVADRLNEQRPSHLPPLNICIEINVDGESSKSGIHPADAEDLAYYCQHLPHLKLRGLMTIPSVTHETQTQRIAFHTLKNIFDNLIKKGLFLDTLSMGMSNDLEAAIAEGGTMVRIGTSIFGSRA